MKLTFLFSLMAVINTFASSYSFAQNVRLSVENIPLVDVLQEIEQQTDYVFLYKNDLIDPEFKVSVDVEGQDVEVILNEVFKSTEIKYEILKKQIILTPNKKVKDEPAVGGSVKVAPQKKLTGKVTDEDGVPIPGVTVVVKGTTIGTVTDFDGNYMLDVPQDAQVLLVSFVGYNTQEITLSSEVNINIVLHERLEELDEVVVVGYGKQNKESVTAAISSVEAKDLVQSPTANISNALAGRLSGLTSIQLSGKPGSDDADLYVRGIGTYAGSTAPLIMVDGVARDSYNNIDPNEIESISILKDASATAVFGVRGANGVILITTRRGQQGAPRVSVSAQTAIVEFTRLPEYLDAYDWTSLFNEKSYQDYWRKHGNDGWDSWAEFAESREANWISEASRYTSDEELMYYKNANNPQSEYYNPYFYPNTDWQSQIFRKSSRQSQYNVNVEGGTEKVKYFVSLGFLDQGGMFQDSYFPFPDEMDYTKKRHNFRANFDFDVNKDFRISVDIGTNFEKITGMNNDSYMWNKRILWANPISSPGLVDGKFVVIEGQELSANNLLYEIANIDFNVTNNSTLNSSVKLSHKLDFITEGLSVNARVAYDSYFSSRSGGGSYTPMLYRISPNENGDKLDPNFEPLTEKSSLSYWSEWYNGKWRKIYGEFSLNYNQSFGQHDVGGLFLFNAEKKYDPGLDYQLPHAYLGLVGRVTYGFAKRYLAEFNMGYNGSENFPEGKRFGFLPAVSLGWVSSAESFFPETGLIGYLKIRGSIGKVGNDNVGGARYLYLPDVWEYSGGYTFGDYNSRSYVNGAIEGTIGNPNVTWETATKANIGFEARLFGDKLSLTYDYFKENRKDILSYKGTIPDIVQASLPAYNLGKVKNWGNEVEFTWRDNIRQVNYWVKGNASTNKNEIVFRDEAITPGLEYQAQTGRPINQPSYLQADGLYNSWADLYEIDSEGNPVLSSPVLAVNAAGETYTNTAGEPVYQKDLGFGGAVLQPGEIKLIDVNEDGVIDGKDYKRSGKTNIPELTYGFSMGFEYKSFDFSLMFQGVSGVARFVQTGESMHFSDNHSLQEVDIYRFTEERYAAGERIEMPIAAYNTSAVYNTFFHKDASYLRLKNMEIGYSISPGILKRIGLTSTRFYVNGSNLLTWSNNKVWGDPENLGNSGYPITRTYNLGVNLNF
ncbi:TonB-dependent receptor [Draconibacterium orientale]|nr:TonB-dependent receptor [Draconibacterium orientale]